MKSSHFYSARQSGFTLVEILVVTAILGIIATVLGSMFQNAMQSQRRLAMGGDYESLRASILGGMDCGKTIPTNPATACSPSIYVPIKSSNNSELYAASSASGDGVVTGEYKIRARCESTQFTIEYQRVLNEKDPVLKQKTRYAPGEWRSLFDTPMCAAAFGNARPLRLLATQNLSVLTLADTPVNCLATRPPAWTTSSRWFSLGQYSYTPKGTSLVISPYSLIRSGRQTGSYLYFEVTNPSGLVVREGAGYLGNPSSTELASELGTSFVVTGVSPGVAHTISVYAYAMHSADSACGATPAVGSISAQIKRVLVQDFGE